MLNETRVLADAEALFNDYRERTAGLSHANKGIRPSELFFFYALVAPLRPRRILESGRARAQSTLVLSRLFPEASIISIESEAHSKDVDIAAERLRGCANVTCHFGDSRRLLPEMVEPNDVVLIDGPKDFRALNLGLSLLRSGKPQLVFLHDFWLGNPVRTFAEHALRSAIFSDAPEWVRRYAHLDSAHPIPPALPGIRRAYGPTLACLQAGRENYALRSWQCRLAQGADRARSNLRKITGASARDRLADFEPESENA